MIGRRAVTGILLFSVAAILAAAWFISTAPRWDAGRELRVRQALFEELQPVALKNCMLARIGGPNDSGFLVCKNLVENVEAASTRTGSIDDDDWACEVSVRYQLPVQQYNCVNAPPACSNGNLVFHEVCLGDRPTQIDSRSYDTLANQISSNGHGGKRLLVKIDVEGAEWDALSATPDEVLAQVDQLAIEFHGVNEQRSLEVLRKLKRTFYVANLYFNNHECSPESAPLPARVYQILLVNKRLDKIDATETGRLPPGPLNARDDPDRPDCQPDIPERAAREAAIRQSLFDELRPVALRNCTLARFGSAFDGGYLMCENLIENLGAAYSYGVGPNDDWGCEVSTRYRVPVHQYRLLRPLQAGLRDGNVELSRRMRRRPAGVGGRPAVRLAGRAHRCER